MTREDVVKLGYQRAVETEDVLPQYADADKQINWWPDFVQKVLGQESQMNRDRIHTSDPVYRAGIE